MVVLMHNGGEDDNDEFLMLYEANQWSKKDHEVFKDADEDRKAWK